MPPKCQQHVKVSDICVPVAARFWARLAGGKGAGAAERSSDTEQCHDAGRCNSLLLSGSKMHSQYLFFIISSHVALYCAVCGTTCAHIRTHCVERQGKLNRPAAKHLCDNCMLAAGKYQICWTVRRFHAFRYATNPLMSLFQCSFLSNLGSLIPMPNIPFSPGEAGKQQTTSKEAVYHWKVLAM